MSAPDRAADSPLFEGHVPGYMIVFLGALVALGPIGMNAYIPAIPAIAEAFGVDAVNINFTLSIFLVGYALGQYFGGAISDQVGRKRIGYLGLGLYIVATLAMSAIDSVGQMLALRLVQALGGGFSTVICMASVRDMYPLAELGRRFATITAIVLVAPLVAPTLGSLLLAFGWQFIFLFKAAYATLLLVLYVLIVPETAPGSWAALSFRTIWASFREVLTRRVDGHLIPLRLALMIALASSILMNFVTNSSTVYLEYFGVDPSTFPFFFGVSVLGFMTLNLYSMRRLRPENAVSLLRLGLRIQIGALAVFLLIVLTGFVSLWTVVPVLVVAVATLGLIGPAGSSTYMSHFSKLAGSAASAYTTLMFAAGGLFGALTGAFYNGSLLPLAITMGIASVLANVISLSVPALRRG